MAAQGYEFYLRVLKVSLTPSLCSLVRDTFSTLVTMATPISSQVKDKNSIFTVHNEDRIF